MPLHVLIHAFILILLYINYIYIYMKHMYLYWVINVHRLDLWNFNIVAFMFKIIFSVVFSYKARKQKERIARKTKLHS